MRTKPHNTGNCRAVGGPCWHKHNHCRAVAGLVRLQQTAVCTCLTSSGCSAQSSQKASASCPATSAAAVLLPVLRQSCYQCCGSPATSAAAVLQPVLRQSCNQCCGSPANSAAATHQAHSDSFRSTSFSPVRPCTDFNHTRSLSTKVTMAIGTCHNSAGGGCHNSASSW
jgi:hypothetical protein